MIGIYKLNTIMEKLNNPTIQEGWTLRDEFAKSAMQAFLSQPNIGEILRDTDAKTMSESDDIICITAFRIANAMLKNRDYEIES